MYEAGTCSHHGGKPFCQIRHIWGCLRRSGVVPLPRIPSRLARWRADTRPYLRRPGPPWIISDAAGLARRDRDGTGQDRTLGSAAQHRPISSGSLRAPPCGSGYPETVPGSAAEPSIFSAMYTSTRPLPGPLAICAPVAGHLPGGGHPRSDDELIAFTLVTLWALATGRSLPDGVPPASLGERDLIEFWADPTFEEVPRP